MRTLREWYESSKDRETFFQEIEALDAGDVLESIRHDLAQPLEQDLWTLAAIRKLKRTQGPRPTGTEEAGALSDSEQSLQWRFIERGYLCGSDEVVIEREIPSSPMGSPRRAVLDLLVLDKTARRPLIVELKQGGAEDPLMGVVFEALAHWAFYKRHFHAIRSMVGEHEVDALCSEPSLAIVAPQQYFVETLRRSLESRRRRKEADVALATIRHLQEDVGIDLRLLCVADDWATRGTDFEVRAWSPT